MITRLALLSLTLLTGCLMGPNYHRPVVPTPCSYRFESADSYGTLDSEWWRQFNDPVLVSLVDEALAGNKDIAIAAANIEQAIGVLLQTRAPLFPQIGYSGSYDRTRISQSLATPAVALTNPQTTLEALATASWEIDLWGRIRRLTEAARASYFATYQARQQVLLSLVAAVANSYIQLRGLDEQLIIAENTRDSYKEEVDYFELQFKYGQTSQMTVVQAKTQYETAAAKIPNIESQIAQTENAISLLLGKNPQSIPRGKSINNMTLPAIPSSLPSELLCQRPDIAEAEMELIAANAEIGAARALYFPSISLTGASGYASRELGNLFIRPSKTWNFVGSLIGPLFTAGAVEGEVKQAEARQQAALISYEKTIQSAFADVENALVARTKLGEALEAQKKLVEAAGEYQRLALLQYHGGYSPYFIVIQAQEQYFPAELSYAETRAQLLSSYVNIYASMGGGWVKSAEEIADSAICKPN